MYAQGRLDWEAARAGYLPLIVEVVGCWKTKIWVREFDTGWGVQDGKGDGSGEDGERARAPALAASASASGRLLKKQLQENSTLFGEGATPQGLKVVQGWCCTVVGVGEKVYQFNI